MANNYLEDSKQLSFDDGAFSEPVKAQKLHSYALSLSYNGAGFSGFAKQKEPQVKTVQGELETALNTIMRPQKYGLRGIETVCAGRTDAGVHALEQIVSFTFPGPALDAMRRGAIARSVNATTPSSMNVTSLRLAKPSFSARFDAVTREYRYRIFNSPEPPTFTRDYSWHVIRPMNIDLMRSAAKHFMGEHDFTSFCAAASADPEKNMHRTIHSIEITQGIELGESIITVQIVGSAFLHSMVRIIVGTLQEVAINKRSSTSIAETIDAKDRRVAGVTAPAHGLTLHQVNYPQGFITVDDR